MYIIIPAFLLKKTLLSKKSANPSLELDLEKDEAMLLQGLLGFHVWTFMISCSVLLPPPLALNWLLCLDAALEEAATLRDREVSLGYQHSARQVEVTRFNMRCFSNVLPGGFYAGCLARSAAAFADA
jgi:hypothetical protein